MTDLHKTLLELTNAGKFDTACQLYLDHLLDAMNEVWESPNLSTHDWSKRYQAAEAAVNEFFRAKTETSASVAIGDVLAKWPETEAAS